MNHLRKTLLVWWRYGKEHEDQQRDHGIHIRANSADVIAAHLDRKIARFRATPEDAWRWWQVDDGLIVERAARPQAWQVSVP